MTPPERVEAFLEGIKRTIQANPATRKDLFQAAVNGFDLDQRIHRNQSTNALGKMSFGILQTFLNRLKSYGMVDKLPEMATL